MLRVSHELFQTSRLPAHTARLIGAARLSRLSVEAVHLVVGGSTSCVAGTASLLASVSLSTHGLLWLVPGGILTATDGEQGAGRHLHELRLVRLLGSDIDGEGESRQSGDGFGEHCDGLIW